MEERPEKVLALKEQPDGTYLAKTLDEAGHTKLWRGVLGPDEEMYLEPANMREEMRQWEQGIEADPWHRDEGIEP